jgi:probable F420-dependent oxidoreductase
MVDRVTAARRRIGLSLPVDQIGLAASLALAQDAESMGYTDVWSSEVSGPDGFTPLAALAAVTKTVRLGVGVVPVQSRPPALLAMTAAALQEMSAGRFCLGIGASSRVVVERWMGLDYALPLTQIRETVAAVRSALAGDPVYVQGRRVRIDGFRLQAAPAEVPIMIGALGAKTLHYAGASTDGVVINLNTAAATPSMVGELLAGARESGRDVTKLEVVCRLLVAADEDDQRLRATLRRFVAGYLAVPAYNAFLDRQGFGEEAAALAAHWRTGRRVEARPSTVVGASPRIGTPA